MIIHIDNFGVAKIYKEDLLLNEGTDVLIKINSEIKTRAVYTHSMKNLPDNTWALYPGSSLSHLLELGLVRGDGAKILKLCVGMQLEISEVLN